MWSILKNLFKNNDFICIYISYEKKIFLNYVLKYVIDPHIID